MAARRGLSRTSPVRFRLPHSLPAEWPAVRPAADGCRGSATVALQLLARFSPFHRGGRNGAVAFGDTAHAARVIGSSGWQPGTRPALAFRRVAGTGRAAPGAYRTGFSDLLFVCPVHMRRGSSAVPRTHRRDGGQAGPWTGCLHLPRPFARRASPRIHGPGRAFSEPGRSARSGRLEPPHKCRRRPGRVAARLLPLEPKRHTPPGMGPTADGATGGERPAHPFCVHGGRRTGPDGRGNMNTQERELT